MYPTLVQLPLHDDDDDDDFCTVTSALKRDTAANGGGDCPHHYWDDLSKRCARPLVSTLERLCPLDALTTNWTLTDHLAINRTCM